MTPVAAPPGSPVASSQPLLTLYTTPVVYFYFDALGDWFARPRHKSLAKEVAPAAE